MLSGNIHHVWDEHLRRTHFLKTLDLQKELHPAKHGSAKTTTVSTPEIDGLNCSSWPVVYPTDHMPVVDIAANECYRHR